MKFYNRFNPQSIYTYGRLSFMFHFKNNAKKIEYARIEYKHAMPLRGNIETKSYTKKHTRMQCDADNGMKLKGRHKRRDATAVLIRARGK